MLLVTGVAHASDTIVGTVTSVNLDQKRLGIEVIRTDSKKFPAGTIIYLEATDIGQIKKGQAVRATVSCTRGKNICRVKEINLLKRCWCKDRTGVRYRLNRAWHHRRWSGRHIRSCPRWHRGR